MKHLLHEYKKTKEECEMIQEAADKRMKERLQKKMQNMMNEMKERIVKLNEKHQMPVDSWTESEVTHHVEELYKDQSMAAKPVVHGKMTSKVYSYDFADNERYMDFKHQMIMAPIKKAISLKLPDAAKNKKKNVK